MEKRNINLYNKKLKKSKITISIERNVDKVNIICNFPGYNKKITLNKKIINKNKIIHSIDVFLPPGKYLYQYEINENIEIDIKKPNNGEYNIINVFDNITKNENYNNNNNYNTNTNSKYSIDDNSIIQNSSSFYYPENKFEKTKNNLNNESSNLSETIINTDEYSIYSYNHKQPNSKTLTNLIEQSKNTNILQSSKSINNDYSNNFSIKGENNIETFEKNNNSIFVDKSIDNLNYNNNQCIIVYHLGEDYLVPIYLVEEKNDVVKLKYIDINSEILVKKEDIVYKKIDNFLSYGNLSDIKNLNEYSILKNIQFRIKTNRPFIFANNLLILFNFFDNFWNNKERDLFLYDYYINYNQKTLFLITGQSQSYIINYLIRINHKINCQNIKHINLYFKIFDKIKMEFLLFKSNKINLFPVFTNKIQKNDLYLTSLIFGEKNIYRDKKINFPFSIISNIIKNKNIIEIIKYILKTHPEEYYIIILLYEFINKKDKFQYIFKIFILSFILFYYQYIPQYKNLSEKLSSSNLIFCSNLFIIYLLIEITECLNDEIFQNNINDIQMILSFYNFYKQDKNDTNINIEIGKIISSFIKEEKNKYDFLYQITNIDILIDFEKKLNKNEEEFLNNLFNDLEIKELKGNYITYLKNKFNNSKYIIETIEKENFNYVKQIYNYNFDNFDSFIQNKKNIQNFFEYSQLIEYINLYRKQNKFFKEFSISNFFLYFLPILSDIDEIYNPKNDKIYVSKIRSYINELQSFQKINEVFLITNDKIMLNFKTYEILMLLLFSLIEEKSKIIQKFFLKKSKSIKIQKIIKNTILIQKIYKRHLYEIYNSKSNTEKINLVLRKYKGNDPLIILLIINAQNTIKRLKKENEELQKRLSLSSKTKLKSKSLQMSNPPILLQKNIFTDDNNSSQNEINELKNKINLARNEYKNLVNIISQYEEKLNNLIKIVNSNEEIKEILFQNGIDIN